MGSDTVDEMNGNFETTKPQRVDLIIPIIEKHLNLEYKKLELKDKEIQKQITQKIDSIDDNSDIRDC